MMAAIRDSPGRKLGEMGRIEEGKNFSIVGRISGKDVDKCIKNAMYSHASMGLLFGEIASQSEVRDTDVTVFVQKDVGRLQVPINDESSVHVFQPYIRLREAIRLENRNGSLSSSLSPSIK